MRTWQRQLVIKFPNFNMDAKFFRQVDSTEPESTIGRSSACVAARIELRVCVVDGGSQVTDANVERRIIKLLSTVPVYLSTNCAEYLRQRDQVLHFLSWCARSVESSLARVVRLL